MAFGILDKYIVGGAVAIIGGLFAYKKLNAGSTSVTSNPPQASTNVPWYLTYNNDPAFGNRQGLALPTLNLNADGSSGCTICSAFPQVQL